jgi:hypothetical protein
MSEVNANIVKSINDKLTVTNNASDTTKSQLRCKKVVFDDFALLKKCITAVVNSKFTIATTEK